MASSARPYQANALKGEGQPIATVFPKEGVTGWADTTMLHTDAKHPSCAYQWMNWSLEPKVQGDVAAWFGSVPASPAGCKASALLGEKGCETNGFNQFDKIAFWKTPQAQGGKFVPYSRWTRGLHRHHGRPLISLHTSSRLLLAARTYPGHVRFVRSRGCVWLPPRCSSNYFADRSG